MILLVELLEVGLAKSEDLHKLKSLENKTDQRIILGIILSITNVLHGY